MLRANNLYCPCCGSKFRTSGCVRGFTCRCTFITTYCKTCQKCPIHCTCHKPNFPKTGNMLPNEKVDKNA